MTQRTGRPEGREPSRPTSRRLRPSRLEACVRLGVCLCVCLRARRSAPRRSEALRATAERDDKRILEDQISIHRGDREARDRSARPSARCLSARKATQDHAKRSPSRLRKTRATAERDGRSRLEAGSASASASGLAGWHFGGARLCERLPSATTDGSQDQISIHRGDREARDARRGRARVVFQREKRRKTTEAKPIESARCPSARKRRGPPCEAPRDSKTKTQTTTASD